MSGSPVQIDVRAYNVGFGDCLLVSFGYAAPVGDGRAERHMLIDFGTNRANPRGPSLKDVAGFISADTHGKLDVVVLTHRHRDHLAGFDPAAGGTTIAGLKPDAVVRPWTETPASSPGAGHSAGQRQLLDTLSSGQSFAANLAAVPFGSRAPDAQSELLGLAAMQVGNNSAIQALDDMAARARPFYLRAGDPLPLDMLPGVTVTVLGPPDPDVWPAVRKEAAKSAEYWLGAGSGDPEALRATHENEPRSVVGDAAAAAALLEPGPARWLIDRIDDHLVRSAERLVHQLDSVLNNTSLVLLIEAAGRTLLFPGDAQIENWAYALTAAPDHGAIVERLKTVELYKVGHHGSRNATPRQSLYPLLAGADPAGRVALMSTLPGTYDQANKVPSDALVAGLSVKPFTLLRTDTAPAGTKAVHLVATATKPFTVVPAT